MTTADIILMATIMALMAIIVAIQHKTSGQSTAQWTNILLELRKISNKEQSFLLKKIEITEQPVKQNEAPPTKDMEALKLRVDKQNHELRHIKSLRDNVDTHGLRREYLKKARETQKTYEPTLQEQIINIMATASKPLTVHEIARQVMRVDGTRGAMAASTRRYLKILLNQGLLERDPDRGPQRRYWAAKSNVVDIKANA